MSQAQAVLLSRPGKAPVYHCGVGRHGLFDMERQEAVPFCLRDSIRMFA
jgi:hypothetical protein